MKVKDLIEYLERQDPEAKVCFYDSEVNDYVQIERHLFKKVSKAKEDFRNHLMNVFGEIEDEIEKNEKIDEEMSKYFKNVNSQDILIGLEN